MGRLDYVLRLRGPGSGLAGRLAELPHDYRVVTLDQAHLVIGPTGLFMVGDGRRAPRPVARRLATLAGGCRDVLCRELAWAPFVDTLVVGVRHRQVDGASVVALHLLVDTLTAGTPMLDEALVARIVDLVDRHRDELERRD